MKGRLLVDISYARTEDHPAGIPRTVKRLLASMPALSGGLECIGVSCHGGQWRRVGGGTEHAPPTVSHAARAPLAGLAARVGPWVSARLPAPVRYAAWLLYQSRKFDRASEHDAPLEPAPGDILLVADASWNYPVWRAVRRARSAGVKVALVVYDLMPLRHPEFMSEVLGRAFGQWLRRMLPLSDAVLCISRATQDDLHAWAATAGIPLPPTGHFRLGCDALGVATGSIRDSIAAILAADEPCFGMIGTLEPKRDHAFVLAAFERLWQRGVAARLVVAGRPTQYCADLLARMLAHPELGKRLFLVTDANDAEIRRIYAACRALLMASRFEGFGLPLIEARTQGCPVIASDLPCFQEIADEGVSFYRQGDSAGFEHEVERHVRTAQARLRMAPFTWEDSARDCLAVLARLLSRPDPQP